MSISLQLTADGSYTLSRGDKRETYHSQNGAVTESNEVFLRNSGVQHRLQRRQTTHVLEIGFGSGLNFLLTALCARHNSCSLSYTGFEVCLPPIDLIRQLLTRNTRGSEQEIKRVIELCGLDTTPVPKSINSECTLSLQQSDALSAELPQSGFHSVYLDAFSQNEAPDFWKVPFLKKLHASLRPGGTLASYSVNRPFRDSLTEAGFEWSKLPGPAGKREVIVACR